MRLGEGVGGCVWGCGTGRSIPAVLTASTSESEREERGEGDEEENDVEEDDLDSLRMMPRDASNSCNVVTLWTIRPA